MKQHLILGVVFLEYDMRIIAGKHKGLNLKTFDFEGTRPTSDKVREAVFSKIQFNIRDSNCLDLFGGTGAITLELLSRGASAVTICDNNPKSIALIRENSLKAKESPNILKLDYKVALSKFRDEGTKFDIIFLDPPYKSDFGNNSIRLISEYNLLADDGILIYECEKGTTVDSADFVIYDEKVYGTIKVVFIRK